ncbi:MAG: RNA polymerase sigma factor [Acidimicrobiales bacterium]
MVQWTAHADRLDDAALLAAIGGGDAAAATVFVRRYQRAVYGLALTMCRDPRLSEDVAQQTFERVWRHAATFDERRGSVRTWTLTITRRLCIDQLRARRPVAADGHERLLREAQPGTGVDDRAAASADAARLARHLDRLSAEQRRAVLLAALGGHTTAEIAEIEGIPLGTAKTRLRQGLIHLREDAERVGVSHD